MCNSYCLFELLCFILRILLKKAMLSLIIASLHKHFLQKKTCSKEIGLDLASRAVILAFMSKH